VRHLLSLRDVDMESLEAMLADAARLKADPAAAETELAGRHGAIMFERPSLRTRLAFEVALVKLGASVSAVPLDLNERSVARREASADVARTVSRYAQIIVVRTRSHEALVEFARWATVPVVNALSDREHPCQVLADLLTMREHAGQLARLTVAYLGAAGPVASSLALAAGIARIRLRIASPAGFSLRDDVLAEARDRGGIIELTVEPTAAVREADVIYTDVWKSEDQTRHLEARSALRAYQVNAALVASAPTRAIVMHEMPAHRGDEITDDVIEGPRSVVFDQAENRLHMAKAIVRQLLVPEN
jgi:ornithine carbamoyltransferase